MNTATAKRLFGINALVAWLGYCMVQVVNIFGLVPQSTPYDPSSNLFGGHAEGLAGAFGRLVDSHGYFTTWSNIVVAMQVLGPERRITPGFIWIPLDVANIHGIAALTSIITLTPGTVSSVLSDDRRHLLVHVLHLEDADAVIAHIKNRYEKPLMEIFP